MDARVKLGGCYGITDEMIDHVAKHLENRQKALLDPGILSVSVPHSLRGHG